MPCHAFFAYGIDHLFPSEFKFSNERQRAVSAIEISSFKGLPFPRTELGQWIKLCCAFRVFFHKPDLVTAENIRIEDRSIMCCKDQLGIVSVSSRIMDQANKKAYHKRMQSCIQFVNKENAALRQDIQQRARKGKKLSGAA